MSEKEDIIIVRPWDDTELPIYKCCNCEHIQAYTGNGEPHCMGCGSILSVVDIVGFIRKPGTKSCATCEYVDDT